MIVSPPGATTVEARAGGVESVQAGCFRILVRHKRSYWEPQVEMLVNNSPLNTFLGNRH